MRKVLVITYYWPPAGGPGVQRWLKFVTYLRDFGVDPVVYIPENPNYPIEDASLLMEIPKGIRIYSHPIKEPYRLAALFFSKKTKRISSGIIQTKNQSVLEKIMLWIRGNFFIPDARKNWVAPSVAYLSPLLASEKIETIITTGPPHSVHLIGRMLKQKHEVRWIADFRDPWTSIGYHKKLKLTKYAQKKHKRLERVVLQGADQIVVTSASTKAEFTTSTDVPINVITNGYDGALPNTVTLDEKFTIAHIGSLLSGRNPENLWAVLSELTKENKAFGRVFELHLIGVVSTDVLDMIYSYGLEPYTRLTKYLSHEEAIARQRRSQILLLAEINSKDTVGIIPGKFFEYLASKRPILAIGPNGWDVGELLNTCSAGKIFDYQEKASVKELLLTWFADYQKGELKANSIAIEKFSRKALTGKLAELI